MTSYSKGEAQRRYSVEELWVTVGTSRGPGAGTGCERGNGWVSVFIGGLGLCNLLFTAHTHSHDTSDINTTHAQTCTGIGC